MLEKIVDIGDLHIAMHRFPLLNPDNGINKSHSRAVIHFRSLSQSVGPICVPKESKQSQ